MIEADLERAAYITENGVDFDYQAYVKGLCSLYQRKCIAWISRQWYMPYLPKPSLLLYLFLFSCVYIMCFMNCKFCSYV